MKTVCIDIDGTISRYIDWVDSKTFGNVLPHCAETVHHLKADGWYVIIYTTKRSKLQNLLLIMDRYHLHRIFYTLYYSKIIKLY